MSMLDCIVISFVLAALVAIACGAVCMIKRIISPPKCRDTIRIVIVHETTPSQIESAPKKPPPNAYTDADERDRKRDAHHLNNFWNYDGSEQEEWQG